LIVFSSLVLVIIVVVVILFFDIGNTAQIFEEFFDKVFFNESDKAHSSSGQRLKQWSRALKDFIGRPLLGNGPGFGVNEDPEGYLSVYLTILSDVGIIALLFFLSFQERLIRKVMSLDTTLRSCLLFSVITSFLHLIVIADFYHAPLWILFVFIQLIYKEKTALKL
jgi:O-antigen ligase